LRIDEVEVIPQRGLLIVERVGFDVLQLCYIFHVLTPAATTITTAGGFCARASATATNMDLCHMPIISIVATS